jgi:TonB family protein
MTLGAAHTLAQASPIVEKDPSWEKYQFLLRSSTLEWLYTEPFVLRIGFTLYDLQGNPVESGTAQESWGPEPVRYFRIDAPSDKEGTDESGAAYPPQHSRESFLVHQALQSIARPFPNTIKQRDFIMDQFLQEVDGSSQDCFALTSPTLRTESTPTYCTDGDNHLATLRGIGDYTLQRKNFRHFHYHWIPTDISLTYGGKLALTAHVLELDDVPSATAARPSAMTTEVTPLIPADALSVLRLKREEPKYPKQAKKKRITGIVLIAATITREGTIADLQIIASPDLLLSESATQAVSKWTFKPYLLRGAPVEVDTTIAVNYQISR